MVLDKNGIKFLPEKRKGVTPASAHPSKLQQLSPSTRRIGASLGKLQQVWPKVK